MFKETPECEKQNYLGKSIHSGCPNSLPIKLRYAFPPRAIVISLIILWRAIPLSTIELSWWTAILSYISLSINQKDIVFDPTNACQKHFESESQPWKSVLWDLQLDSIEQHWKPPWGQQKPDYGSGNLFKWKICHWKYLAKWIEPLVSIQRNCLYKKDFTKWAR